MPRSSTALIRELRTIRTSFRQLATAFGKIAPHLATVPAPVTMTSKGRPRRRPRLSRAQRAALKLQGKYMGTMRGLKPGQRAKVKKIRAAKGVVAAIKAAERMV
jgi:hypothetical protein